jgi:hypothetical protein
LALHAALPAGPLSFGTKRMFCYFACGLRIHSAFSFPELIEVEGPHDAIIRIGEVHHPLNPTTDADGCFLASPEEVGFFWPDVGALLIRNGTEIVFDPASGVEQTVVRLYILGRALSLLLQQRGLLVLHASSIAFDGGAVAFLGAKGWGKSTTAAALHASGYNVVSDDLLALQLDDGMIPMVYPAFPQLKLWPEAATSVGCVVETLPRIHPDYEKRARRVTGGFSQSPLPLKRIYVLGEASSLEVERLSAQEAFIEIVRHSNGLRLLKDMDKAASHFYQCIRLAGTVPVCILKRPYSLAGLSEVVSVIERDFSHGHSAMRFSSGACD